MISHHAGVIKSVLLNVILSEAKNLGSNSLGSVTQTEMFRFAQHDSAIYDVAMCCSQGGYAVQNMPSPYAKGAWDRGYSIDETGTRGLRRASSLPAVCLHTRRPTLMG